jgi:hypothetical protein
MTMKNSVSWYVTQCGSCNSRCFGGTYRLHHQDEKYQRATDVSTNYLKLFLAR